MGYIYVLTCHQVIRGAAVLLTNGMGLTNIFHRSGILHVVKRVVEFLDVSLMSGRFTPQSCDCMFASTCEDCVRLLTEYGRPV